MEHPYGITRSIVRTMAATTAIRAAKRNLFIRNLSFTVSHQLRDFTTTA